MLPKQVCLLAATICLLMPSLRAQDGSVDVFYDYITGIAADAGFDTSTLPANPTAIYKESVAAYFWGFPLETTYRSQISFLNTYGLAVNSLYAPGTIDTGTTVEAPDVNVLYVSGFLDLSGTNAFVLKVPDTTATNTYNVMQIVDAYADTTLSVGTRNYTTSASSNVGGNYLLVGPGYDTSQPLPAGIISTIQSATAQSWLVGRMAVDNLATALLPGGGPTPYNLVAGGVSSSLSLNNSVPLAQSYAITPLADYLNGQTAPIVTSPQPTTPQQDALAAANATTLTGQAFFQYVGNSVAQNGVPSTPGNDQLAMYANFAAIGLTTSGYTPPSAPIQTTMNQAAADAATMLEAMALNTSALPGGGATATGWTVNTTLGEYAATYNGWVTSAITGYIGTIASLAKDGTYPQTTISANGAGGVPLSGANSYTITFPAGQLPPVEGFWSITVYDLAGNIVPNTGNTYYGSNVYAVGSMQMANVLGVNLNTTPVTFYLQNTPPADSSLMPYWLPIPAGNFELLLRMYFPDNTDPSILNGTYTIPAVVTAPAATTQGVTMDAAKNKTRATFTITNTGSTATTFNLRQTRQVTNAYPGSKPAKPGKSPFKITTSLGGVNITRTLANNTATIALSPLGTAQVVVKVKAQQRIAFKRTIRLALSATSQTAPSVQGTAKTKIILPANPE